jgi:CubicO group peptidase (beta-lactamase class C family)
MGRAAALFLVPLFVACASPPSAISVSSKLPATAPPDTSATAEPTAPVTVCGGQPDTTLDTTSLDGILTTNMKAAGFPGMSVALIGDGKVKWAKGYGFAVEEERRATPDTLFMLASISKAVTAVALMQLMEDPSRGLSLDQDIDDHLAFPVRNPNFPDTPITYRMLLTHTSGLIDSQNGYWDIEEPTPLNPGDSPIPLGDFLRGYVARPDSWANTEPGGKYAYANTGASLLGLIVETLTSSNLQDYSKKNIFDRIGMNESSFFLRGLDLTHVAMPYDTALKPIGQYGYPNYPAGQLRTSATQLARFLLMFAGNGSCDGQQLLKDSTIADMKALQFPDVVTDQGLIWFYDKRGGKRVFGHNGDDAGVSTDMFYDPQTGKGYVLLANGSARLDNDAAKQKAMTNISDQLMKLTDTL